MKKVFKHVIPLVMVIVLCVCMAAPAFADGNISTYMGSNFPKREHGNSGGYVGAIQRYMYHYNSTTRSYIANSGGIDCSFGDGTYQAVMAYQRARGLTIDGVVGPKTWTAIGGSLQFGDTTSSGKLYCYYKPTSGSSSYNIIAIKNYSQGYVSSSTIWYYVNSSGGLTQFRPVPN